MNRFIVPLMLVIVAYCGVVATALAGTIISLDLVIPLDPDHYIQPTCAKCEDIKLETQSGGTQALLTLTYQDEQQRDFEGTVEVTVVLDDGAEDTVLIEDVWLPPGESDGWLLDAPSTGSWLDVEKAVLRFVAD